MRVELFTRRWPVLCLIAVLAMTAQAPRVTADDCHCHSLPLYSAGGGNWWYITAVIVSGGTGSCPGGVVVVAYVRAPECHKDHLPYPSCNPGDSTPCDHCPAPGDGCTDDAMAEQQNGAGTEISISDAPSLPRTPATPYEGVLGDRLEQIGIPKARFLEVNTGNGPRWVKLTSVTLRGKGSISTKEFTVRHGFEIDRRPAGPVVIKVNESELKTKTVDDGPGTTDDWELRLWEDPKQNVTYAIRYKK